MEKTREETSVEMSVERGAGRGQENREERSTISPRKIVVYHGKWSTPMKKNGRQIPDRFFITSSP